MQLAVLPAHHAAVSPDLPPRFREPRTAIIFFYISNEGVSLLENAAQLGLPVPEKMKDVLEQLHDRSEKGDHHEQQ